MAKEPKGPKEPKESKAPKQPKAPKEPKAPKAPKETKGSKKPEESKEPKEHGEPKEPKEPKEHRAPKGPKDYIPRLQVKYRDEIVPALMKEFNYTNQLEVPKLDKIVVNMGLGIALQDPKVLDHAVEELGLITGQRPVVTKSRKSIANFKLREGQRIGAMVTLRGDRMYEFLDRLVSMALPRVRDFRGTSPKAFDGRGNYSIGIREQIIFPEINYDKIDRIKGMNVTINTTARTDEEGKRLLELLGMPFRS